MLTFFREDSVWPFAHALVPSFLYISSRNIYLAVFLTLLFEPIEQNVIAHGDSAFKERWDDSLLGDPFVGLTGIFTFYLLDKATGWDKEFRATIHWLIRLICFGIIGFVATFLIRFEENTGSIRRIGVLIMASVSVVTAAVYIAILLLRANSRFSINSVYVWIFYVIIHTIAVVPDSTGLSMFPFNVWMRVAFINLTFLSASVQIYWALKIEHAKPATAVN